MKALPSSSSFLPQALSAHPSTLDVRISTYEFCEGSAFSPQWLLTQKMPYFPTVSIAYLPLFFNPIDMLATQTPTE
jgi:hypothetical protein